MDTRLGDSIPVTGPLTSCCFLRLLPMCLYMSTYRVTSLCSSEWLFSICGAGSCAYSCALHFSYCLADLQALAESLLFRIQPPLLINVTSNTGPWMSHHKLRCTKTRVDQMSPATQQILMALANWHPNLYHALTDLPHLWMLLALFLV